MPKKAPDSGQVGDENEATYEMIESCSGPASAIKIEITPEMVEAFRKACREWKDGPLSFADPVGLGLILSYVLKEIPPDDAGS